MDFLTMYTKEKCRHLKKLTCKGTLRQVFICLSPHNFVEFSGHSLKQWWASTHVNRLNARRRLKTLPSIGRSNRLVFSKKRKFWSLPLSQCLKRFTVVFKSAIFTPLNFFQTIAHSTAILGHRLSNFSIVNLRFFSGTGSRTFHNTFNFLILCFFGLFFLRWTKAATVAHFRRFTLD